MPSVEPWLPLDRFDDPGIPKLFHLKRAARAGFEVPETRWAPAEALRARPPLRLPEGLPDAPCIVRSGSPTEDSPTTSNAGQFFSEVVDDPGDFPSAVARVVASLPRVGDRPAGVVFVQPLIQAETAGVTFFDGFYYEESFAAGSNAALTSGRDRGHVRRGHVRRGEAHDAWLVRLHKLLGGPVDVEWAIPWAWGNPEPVLLQARPALFPIRRSETLSLANHKEILGDPPSPWMVGLLVEVARPVMGFFERVDPEVATWEEPYAVELGERAWMNFSAFFRLMDHWGLPRSMVTRGVGGEVAGPLDDKLDLGRVARKLPTLIRKAAGDYAAMFAIREGLRRLDADLASARTLPDLWDVNAGALAFSIRTNFAIMSVLSLAVRLRTALGLKDAGRVVTREMMAEYAGLAGRPDPADRLAGLDAWLARYGHRGPLESDPARPRFDELRETLRAALERGPTPALGPEPRRPWRIFAPVRRFFYVYDEIRERFRDRLMRWWQRLRARILEEARLAVERGHLEAAEDVFFLRGDDLAADPATWRGRVVERRRRRERAKDLELPNTATRDEIEAAIAAGRPDDSPSTGRFRGIGLGSRVVSGTAVRAADLKGLLEGPDLPESPVLVASTLEPSWAVVFPRFAAVVVDLGGELSHASILLREARIPAVVNARGAFRAIVEGDRLVVDPIEGEVRVGPATSEGRNGD